MQVEARGLIYDATALLAFHHSLGQILDATQAAITDAMLEESGEYVGRARA